MKIRSFLIDRLFKLQDSSENFITVGGCILKMASQAWPAHLKMFVNTFLF